MLLLIVNDDQLSRAALENVFSSRRDINDLESVENAEDALERLKANSSQVLVLDMNKAGSEPVFLERRNPSHPSVAPGLPLEAIAHALQTQSNRFTSLETRRPQMPHSPQKPRIAIKVKGRILFINPTEVIAVQAEGNYVLLQRDGDPYSLRESISAVEEKLRPYGFIQIHRSVLVNTSFVEEIKPNVTGEYSLRMKDGKQYSVTRTYKKNLKALADSWIGNGTFVTE